MENVEHGAVEIPHLPAHIVARSTVDLMKHLAVGHDLAARLSYAAEERGLPIAEGPAMQRHQDAGGIVAAEDRAGELEDRRRGRCACRAIPDWSSSPIVRSSSPIQVLMADGVIVYGVSHPGARFSSDIGR